MQIELAEENLFFIVWHHLAEIFNDFIASFFAGIVEDDVDGLCSNLLEIQLRPNGIFEFGQTFLPIWRVTWSL